MTIFTRSQYVENHSSLPPLVIEINELCIMHKTSFTFLWRQCLNIYQLFSAKMHTFLGITYLVDLYAYIYNYHNLYCNNETEYKKVKF